MAAWSSAVSIAPLGFVLSVNLLRVRSAPSLVKVLNCIGPSIDPWVTVPATDLQLVFMLLVTSLEVQPLQSILLSTYLAHVSLSSSLRMPWDTVLKAFLKSR